MNINVHMNCKNESVTSVKFGSSAGASNATELSAQAPPKKRNILALPLTAYKLVIVSRVALDCTQYIERKAGDGTEFSHSPSVCRSVCPEGVLWQNG